MRMRFMLLSDGAGSKLRARVRFCRPAPNNNKLRLFLLVNRSVVMRDYVKDTSLPQERTTEDK